jgi:predicted Rossmann fold nucleotide-binding protein DprA/Smf involved in DNA uptake
MPCNSTPKAARFNREPTKSARAVIAQHAALAAQAYLSACPRASLSAELGRVLAIVPSRHKRAFRAAFLDAIGGSLSSLEEQLKSGALIGVDGFLLKEMVSTIGRVGWLAAYGALSARSESSAEALEELVRLRLGLGALGLINL